MPSVRERLEQLHAELGAIDRERAAIVAQIEALRPIAEAEEKQDLPETYRHDTGKRMKPMHPIVKAQYSQSARANEATQKLLDAIHEAGIPSLRALADLANEKFPGRKISQPILSMASAGDRTIDRDVTEWIEKLTGYKARNWKRVR